MHTLARVLLLNYYYSLVDRLLSSTTTSRVGGVLVL
jgi:hypothetical protein